MNVLLIGPRGCGKTTVGLLLAERCGRRFVDLDDRVQGRFAEPTITGIWDAHGESAWRAAELDALRETLAGDTRIIALGGGVPMIDAARDRIEAGRAAGQIRVAYLKCPLDVLTRRLRAVPGDRPSLTGTSVTEEIAAVLRRREPTYEALADVICDASDPDPRAVARDVMRMLGLAPAAPGGGEA
ncbi:MAG: shikimate kinase [Planctomycetota bacterium]|nr:shikimate kinase [Planctomycetota bacterium]